LRSPKAALFFSLVVALAGLAGFNVGASAQAVRDATRTAAAQPPPSVERPDQQLDRLNATINSGSLQGAALAQALRERALLNATTGRLGFAHQDIDRLLAMDARDADAHLARGLAFLVGNQPEAIRSFTQVVQLQPKRGDGYRGRAWASLVAGDYGAAAKDFAQLSLLEPEEPEAYRGRAWAELYAKNYDRAIREFSEVMRLVPGHPEASAGRGLGYYLSGRFQDARADFRSAIRYGRPVPSTALTYNTLVFDDWLRERRVFQLLEERTQANPSDVEVWLAFGAVGHRADAFDRALKIKPEDVDILMLRAIFHATPVQGTTAIRGYNRPAALADLTEVIRLKPDHTEAYFWRALLLAMDKGALPAAIADCEKALAVSQRDPTLTALLERLKAEQRDWEQAKQRAAIAQAQFEKDSEVYAVAFLIGLAAVFAAPAEPPDPFRRSYLDDLRLRQRFLGPRFDSRGRLISR
jgi:tetratricopeptide (TPR) repeat protein